VGQVDGVVVVGEVDGEGEGVVVAVLLVEHRLVAVVPDQAVPINASACNQRAPRKNPERKNPE